MSKKIDDTMVYRKVIQEQGQGHETRKHLFVEIEKILNIPVVSFFTSFNFPVMIEDTDADMLEGIVQKMDLSKGLALIVSSPGGNGLTAERIINICKNYSGTNDYCAIVPSKAKSAATMICFGASKIYMGPTSELGPVDPQVYVSGTLMNRFSAKVLVNSYKSLFQRAAKVKGNLEPYLQQLQNHDERDIKVLETMIELSKDIAIRSLKNGMLSDLSDQHDKDIADQLNIFFEPEVKKTHGRPIYWDEAESCGLKIERMEINTELWDLIYELYIRTNNFVNTTVSKCMESAEHSFMIGRPEKEGD